MAVCPASNISRCARTALPQLRSAVTIEPPPPDVLAVGARWESTLAAPGALADDSYVRVVFGTLFKDQKIKVTRYDKSGKHAYGYAYGHVRKHGWVVTADLCK